MFIIRPRTLHLCIAIFPPTPPAFPRFDPGEELFEGNFPPGEAIFLCFDGMFLRSEAIEDRNEGMWLLFEAISPDLREFRQIKNPDLPGSSSGYSPFLGERPGKRELISS